MIVARDPTFHSLLKSQLFDGKSANRSVRVGEWERLKECCQERVWKKQKQTCNQKEKKEKNRHMTFDAELVSYSNPCWKLPNQSTMTESVSFDRFCRQQAKRHTLSAWHLRKIGYTSQGQMPRETLRCTLCIRGGIKSMGCGIMEPVKRFQRSGINTSWPFVWHLLVALLGIYSW